jgi:hypothetical protein
MAGARRRRPAASRPDRSSRANPAPAARRAASGEPLRAAKIGELGVAAAIASCTAQVTLGCREPLRGGVLHTLVSLFSAGPTTLRLDCPRAL